MIHIHLIPYILEVQIVHNTGHRKPRTTNKSVFFKETLFSLGKGEGRG